MVHLLERRSKGPKEPVDLWFLPYCLAELSLWISVHFIPVQTLGYPRVLVLRNVCPQWWMGSKYQWECWNGLSDTLRKNQAPGWEMRPCPTGTCRYLLKVLQALKGVEQVGLGLFSSLLLQVLQYWAITVMTTGIEIVCSVYADMLFRCCSLTRETGVV